MQEFAYQSYIEPIRNYTATCGSNRRATFFVLREFGALMRKTAPKKACKTRMMRQLQLFFFNSPAAYLII
jgi:hypothetical protein